MWAEQDGATQGSALAASVWEARAGWIGVWSGYLFCFLPALSLIDTGKAYTEGPAFES